MMFLWMVSLIKCQSESLELLASGLLLYWNIIVITRVAALWYSETRNMVIERVAALWHSESRIMVIARGAAL